MSEESDKELDERVRRVVVAAAGEFKELADAVLDDENCPRELKEKARKVLKNRGLAALLGESLPDGHPVHEAAKRGAGLTETQTAD